MDITLREWEENDLENLVYAANNMKVAAYMTDTFPHPYTSENGKQFLKLAADKNVALRLAISVKDKAVGAIGIHPQSDIFRKNAELGYWLAEEYWRQGIMTEAIRQIIPLAFEHYPISRLFARVYGNNIASQKTLEKTGFTLEAHIKNSLFKNGQFLDELIYAVRS